MTTARIFVRAILVTDGRSPHLPDVFDAIGAQTVQPDSLHVVAASGADLPDVPTRLRAELSTSGAPSLADAVDEVLAAYPALPHEYLWILHDDSAPLPAALAALSATARKRRRAGVIGAAHVRWDDANRLVNLGTTVSRVGARRVTLVEEDDVNQGQYHERDDVLAVSLAGALIRRDVWQECAGVDRAYAGWGDSIDFCRRTWHMGNDVVIVPEARIRHSQESLYGRRESAGRGRRSTYVRRRTGEWYHALAWASWWAVPLLLAWVFVSAATRAVGRIAQNEPTMVGEELVVPVRVLGRLGMLKASRAAIARSRVVPAPRVRPLLASVRTVVRHVRARELGAYEQWRAHTSPSDVVKAELALAGKRRRKVLGVVALVATAVSAMTFGWWVPALIAGNMPLGESLGVSDLTAAHLWERSWTGWSMQGFGAPALDGWFAALMLPLSLVPGGLPVGVGLLLAGAAVWATLTAWAAAGAVTRSLWVRALVALAYGTWPVHLASAADGRVGSVIAHIMVPVAALALVRAVGWHRGEIVGGGEEFPARRSPSPSAAMAAAASMAAITVAAPVLLAPLIAIVAGLGAVAGRFRWRAWATALVPLVMAGPALVAWWQAGPLTHAGLSVLARENGPTALAETVAPWRLLLGGAQGWGSGAVAMASLALGAMVLLAVGAAIVSGRARSAVVGATLVAAVGLTTAAVAQAAIAVHPDSAGMPGVHGWPGPAIALTLVGLLGAIAAASRGIWQSGPDTPASPRRRVYLVATVAVAVLAVGSHVVVGAWHAPDEHAVAMGDRAVLPLVASLEQDVQTSQRVIVIGMNDDGAATYTVLTTDGTDHLSGRAHYDAEGVPVARANSGQPSPTPADISSAVASLVSAGEGASADLAAWGIGVIVAAPGAAPVVDSMEQIPEFTLMGASELGTSWRVSRPDNDAPVAHAWIASADGLVIPLDWRDRGVDVVVEAPVRSTIVVAAAADSGWYATLNGEHLARVPDPYGRVAFALDAGQGDLEIGYRDGSYRVWWWCGTVVLVWSLIGAIPLHGRRLREVAP